MDKIEAMKTLSNAFWYVHDRGILSAADVIEDKFNYLRRSLRLTDLRPTSKTNEGLNGRMPTYF